MLDVPSLCEVFAQCRGHCIVVPIYERSMKRNIGRVGCTRKSQPARRLILVSGKTCWQIRKGRLWEFGLQSGKDVEVLVHEETAHDLHLTVPTTTSDDLFEAELAMVGEGQQLQ
jgi:hypothetical protein